MDLKIALALNRAHNMLTGIDMEKSADLVYPMYPRVATWGLKKGYHGLQDILERMTKSMIRHPVAWGGGGLLTYFGGKTLAEKLKEMRSQAPSQMMYPPQMGIY